METRAEHAAAVSAGWAKSRRSSQPLYLTAAGCGVWHPFGMGTAKKRKGRGESGLLPAALSRREGKKLAGNVNRTLPNRCSRVFREAGNAGQASLRNSYLLMHQPPCFDAIGF